MSQLITKFTHKIELWASKNSLVYWFAAQYYRNVIQKEIDLANITDSDNVLFIGGGVCPLSAILLHQHTGAKLTVIDNNPSCIKRAQRNVDRLGLSDYVRILYDDGVNIGCDLTEYSVVHFAMQVSPMELVFHKVEKKVLPGTKLLVRKPKKHVSLLYCTLSSLTHCSHIMHSGAGNIGSTLLYVKKERKTQKHKTRERIYEKEMSACITDTAITDCPIAV